MSFRGDGQRRYGQVPPVQYPVSGQYTTNQQQQQQQQQPQGQPQPQPQQDDAARRLSFNNGDDAGYNQPPSHAYNQMPSFSNSSQPVHDELFISSASAAAYQSASNPMSGYPHTYQDPSVPAAAPSQESYNPQTYATNSFSRTQSTTLPYHPHPSSANYSTTSPSLSATSPSSTYSHQTYNPALYANQQQQQAYPGYSSYDSQPTSPPYGPSPGAVYSPAFSQSMHSPGLSSGYQQSLSSPTTLATSAQSPTPTYDPSQYAPSYQSYASPDYSGSSSGYSPNPAHAAPYPMSSQMPAVAEHPSSDQTAHYNRPDRSGSHTSTNSQGLQRHPTNAPLPSRPLDSLDGQMLTDGHGYESSYQDSLFQEIEAEVTGGSHRRPRPAPIDGHIARREAEEVRGYASPPMTTPGHALAGLGRSPQGRSPLPLYTTQEDEEDPEGAAGALAMGDAAQHDLYHNNNHYQSGNQSFDNSKDLPPRPTDDDESSSDGEFGNVDLGALGGGFLPPSDFGYEPRPLPTPGNMNDLRSSYRQNVEMDYGNNTGGLQPPREHRLSFDENDEHMSLHSHPSGADSPGGDTLHEPYYGPGPSNTSLSNRPLPPPPGSDSSSLLSANSIRHPQHSHSLSADARAHNYDRPDLYFGTGIRQDLQPERAASLSGYSNTPSVQAPHRSHTDAEQHTRNQRHMGRGGHVVTDHASIASSTTLFNDISLPTGRRKKFIPSKLTPADFLRCLEPWALSSVEAWIREMASGEPDLKEKTVDEALTALFVHKVPTMNVADAEVLSSNVVVTMLKTGVLVPDEEWVKFGDAQLSGVLWQMTGSGCYAPKLHEHETHGRCYSYHCTRTLKKVDLGDVFQEGAKVSDDWASYYALTKGLTKEEIDSRPRKETDRQNILHEIVTGEENYIKQLDFFRSQYRDILHNSNPPILNPDRRDKFLAVVFGKIDMVLQINKDNLLAQLKYRQQEQGPWISGFSDLFREWIRKAKEVYISYATGYPRATYMVRKELSRNILFKTFLEERQKLKLASKQDWTHFLFLPLQRLQRYTLLLESVDGKMITESDEKANLQKAIKEVKEVTLECDAKVAETNKRVEMMELSRMLVLRPGFQSQLNLDHLGRTLIMQGELQRLGNKGMRWVDTHALLFDHYLILAKVVAQYKDSKDKKYDVSREPIPMPLLFLESNNDEPIIKQKGITAPLRGPVGAAGPQISKVNSNGSGRPGIEHSTTASSVNTLNTTQSNDQEGKILYPFRIKHLGHEVYTLYASSARDRMEWCTKIVEAKTMHAAALFSQNAEPFRLRVLADASFHYDASSLTGKSAGVAVKGTPLDRAIESLEDVLGSAQGVAPVCRAQVNCATGFSAFGKAVIAVGTDYGVFITDPSSPRGWTRSVQATKVTQIAVLEEFNIALLISDKNFISYPLDVIAPVSEFAPPAADNTRRTPLRLAKDVTYFATAKMKDRTLVFYKRKEGLHTSFKVLEPLYHKATEKKSRFFGGRKSASGSTDTFRDFDEFFFPVECYSLSIFQTYIAVATAKGIEMLTLDKKQPMSIPDLKAPAIANIASRIRDQRPLGMFRLNENEFVLAYEDCAVYVDKHGDVSRTLIMEYTGKQKKAKSAAMYGQYLLLFNEDYVEVRNADNGRLRQIIAGRDVRVIDYGIRGPTGGNAVQAQSSYGHNGQLVNAGEASKETVKLVMSHPELAGRQIILEMLLNDGHVENQ